MSTRGRGTFRGRGRAYGQTYNGGLCNYWRLPGHYAQYCWKKQNDIWNGVLPQSNYATIDSQFNGEQLFTVRHVMGNIVKSTDQEWFIDSRA